MSKYSEKKERQAREAAEAAKAEERSAAQERRRAEIATGATEALRYPRDFLDEAAAKIGMVTAVVNALCDECAGLVRGKTQTAATMPMNNLNATLGSMRRLCGKAVARIHEAREARGNGPELLS